jgi:hypothetical protein
LGPEGGRPGRPTQAYGDPPNKLRVKEVHGGKKVENTPLNDV